MRHISRAAFAGFLLFLAPSASAHQGGVAGGFSSGFMHPVLGWDHIVAMVAVGLWGAFLGRPAIWVLPIVFPLAMCFGGATGLLHLLGIAIGLVVRWPAGKIAVRAVGAAIAMAGVAFLTGFAAA